MVSNVRFWFSLAVMTVLTVLLAALTVRIWYDHLVLQERGLVVTATVHEFHSHKHGVTVFVIFTDRQGELVEAYVHDPPESVRLELGGTMQVRYDPEKPSGRIVPVGADSRPWVRYFMIGIVAVLAVFFGRSAVLRLRGAPPG